MSDTEETAKAVQEVAKTASNALDKTAEMSRFLAKIIGPAIEDLGAIAKQYTEYWKLRNALSLREKFERVLTERGNPPLSSLPLRIGLPLLDAAVTEDEEQLQTLWANLLASAMSETEVSAVTKTYVEILKQIDIVDAELIATIYSIYLYAVVNPNHSSCVNTNKARNVIQVSVAINNLERLGLVKLHEKSDKMEGETVINIYFLKDSSGKEQSFSMNVSLTLLGIHFMRACTDRKLLSNDGYECLPADDRFEYHKPSAKS